MAVVGWTTKPVNVTCRACRARLAHAAAGHAEPFTLAQAHPSAFAGSDVAAANGSDGAGELARAASSS
jgi:hypothetical protein